MRENIFQTSRACTDYEVSASSSFPHSISDVRHDDRTGRQLPQADITLPASAVSSSTCSRAVLGFLRLLSSAVFQELQLYADGTLPSSAARKLPAQCWMSLCDSTRNIDWCRWRRSASGIDSARPMAAATL